MVDLFAEEQPVQMDLMKAGTGGLAVMAVTLIIISIFVGFIPLLSLPFVAVRDFLNVEFNVALSPEIKPIVDSVGSVTAAAAFFVLFLLLIGMPVQFTLWGVKGLLEYRRFRSALFMLVWAAFMWFFWFRTYPLGGLLLDFDFQAPIVCCLLITVAAASRRMKVNAT